MNRARRIARYHCLTAVGVVWCLAAISFTSCARLPYTKTVIRDDARMSVVLQRAVGSAAFSHPVKLERNELIAILQGYSYRPQQRLPLRWYSEEKPPQPVFRQDELDVLAPPLLEGLRSAGPDERVHFELRAPGYNPAIERDVVAGWVAVRAQFFYLALDYVHVQLPIRKADIYDRNYPTPPPLPLDYLLFFESGRFWTKDEYGASALQYKEFLQSLPGTAPTTP
jgi:hypothetical protein